MKLFKSNALLFAFVITILSCKKSDTQNSGTNWSEELKGSVWAGEFQLTTGAYQGLQTFSILMNSDNTLTWYDTGGTLPAVWSANGNKVTVTFTNGNSFSADVSKDSWSNFSNVSANPRNIANLSRTSIPQPAALENSIWKGKSSSGSDIKITFMPGNKLLFFAGLNLPAIPYTISGAGIKISNFAVATISSVAYLIPVNNFMRAFQSYSDFGGTYYGGWSVTKQ